MHFFTFTVDVLFLFILLIYFIFFFFFFSSRRRHTRCLSDWSSDVCSSDLLLKKEHDVYHNTEETLAFLSGSESEGLRPFLFFWDQISYLKWTKVQEAFRSEERRVGKSVDLGGRSIM